MLHTMPGTMSMPLGLKLVALVSTWSTALGSNGNKDAGTSMPAGTRNSFSNAPAVVDSWFCTAVLYRPNWTGSLSV